MHANFVNARVGFIILLLVIWTISCFAQPTTVAGQFTDTKAGMFYTFARIVPLYDTPLSSVYAPFDLHNAKFGQITMKGETFDVITGLNDGKEILLVDGNRNKNLSDDEVYVQTSSVTNMTTYIVKLIFNDGSCYYVALWRMEDKLYYCGITRKEGWLYVGNKNYKAAIADTDSDGWYTKDAILLMVDLNENGKFDGPELFRKYVKIGKEYFTIESVTKNGDSIVLERCATSVLIPFVGELFPDISFKDVSGREINLVDQAGQWKVIYFNFLTDSEMPKIKTWLDALSGFLKMGVKPYVLLLVSSCYCQTCEECPEDVESLAEKYKGLTIIPISREELDEVTIRLRLLYPETIMVVSPDNVLIYRTNAGAVTEGVIWKHTISMPTVEQFSRLIKALIEN
ncbi:hypothetical protein [Thermosipho sp. (in: thermotogales)]|jgi:hypothetical protein|uniref:TlpA family protein disulfide reductase n=1 Tax=Thermosipho sp. (in: thermotogales) TaxID=1968895 RepID=UPI00257F59F4|nr:hypothetical protein [Thermosipho sp. (in: thermotogales)]MBZ4651006.1 hypothetical protein [Thermosipho sp. (in: thermotogales)]